MAVGPVQNSNTPLVTDVMPALKRFQKCAIDFDRYPPQKI